MKILKCICALVLFLCAICLFYIDAHINLSIFLKETVSENFKTNMSEGQKKCSTPIYQPSNEEQSSTNNKISKKSIKINETKEEFMNRMRKRMEERKQLLKKKCKEIGKKCLFALRGCP